MYIQYNPTTGAISGTVVSDRAPVHPYQIEVENGTNVMGKRVNPETLQLEDDDSHVEE